MSTMSSSALLLCFVSVTITVSYSNEVTERKGITGNFIELKFPELPETLQLSNVMWELADGTVIVKNKNVAPDYHKKVTFSHSNYSIRLDHLTEKDSGIYRASNYTEWKTTALASIKLTVFDPVPKPVISISHHPGVDSSGQNCSFSVNCSCSNSWVLYNCDEKKCLRQSSEETTVNITITRGNGQVECSASNPVSTKKQTLKTCDAIRTAGPQQESHFQRNVALIISVICAAALLVLCGSLIWKKCRNSKAVGTSTKHTDVPTVIVTGSHGDEPGSQCVSIYSVINKSAKCSAIEHSAQITSTSQNQTQRLKSSEEKHKSKHQQKNRGKQCPQEDNAMTIYTTATKPQENPSEDIDRTVYATATNPLEEDCPLEDTARTVYDTARSTTQRDEQRPLAVTNRTETETNQPDTVYYTLGHITSGQQ